MKTKLSDHFTYKKLIKFTLPSIAMLIFTSIYSVVDGFFISNFAGKTPFAAINLIFPVIMILGTFGFMFGAGGTALVAKTYGEGDKDKANRYFSLFVYLAFFLGVLLAILGIIFTPKAAILLGATKELLKDCVVYARILLIALPFFMLQIMFQSFFVAAEKPQLGLIVTVISGVTNMVLDAVLVLSFPPHLKLVGAALATAISQTVGGVLPLIYFFRKNSSILRLGKTKFELRPIIKASANGSSEFMTNISMSVVGVLYNLQLMKYAGENGIAAYGVMMYVSMIFSSAFIGYSVGVAPVISYHFGAQNHSELKSLLRKSLILVSLFGVSMVLSGELSASLLSKLFVGYDPDLYNLTFSGFKVFALSFGFMGFGIFASGFFTALNDGLTSAIIAFVRTLVLQSLAVMILPLFWGINGVWWSVATAEGLSLILSAFFLKTKQKKFLY